MTKTMVKNAYKIIKRADFTQVKLMLDTNPELVNKRDKRDCTLLHTVADIKGRENIVEVLIAAGADVNATDIAGQTPLHMAARCGNIREALGLNHRHCNCE